MERYDPRAEFVRQWVPEYGTHRYPLPIVTHEVGRNLYLQAFARTAAGRDAIRQERREETEQTRRGVAKSQANRKHLQGKAPDQMEMF